MTPSIPSPRRAVLAVSVLLASTLAGAQSVRDPQWAAQLQAQRWADVSQAAQARLDAHPEDADAWAALARAAQNLNELSAREAAFKRFEGCVSAQPASAVCHYGVGVLLGRNAMEQGMMKAAFSAGRIKDELARAVELDPQFYAARSALVQFYLMAPGIAGGSTAKAKDLAQAAVARQPEHAKLLQAAIALADERAADAERLLASVQPGSDAELTEALREQWVGYGFGYLADKQPAKARGVFERLVKTYPESAQTHYGLGRSLLEQQSYDAAIAALETAAKLPGNAALPIDYRLGIAWQAKGDVAKARAAFTRYLANANASPRNLEDAKKRLAALG